MATELIPTDIQRVRAQRPFPLDWLSFSDRMAEQLRLVAHLWWVVATVAFAGMALRGGIPMSPDRDDWEFYAQLGLLVLVTIGGLLTWRWEGAGAALIVAGAVGLGALAALEFHPWRALLVALAFYLPGLLLWLTWQRTKPLWELATLAAALVLLLVVGGFAANRTYATYFGPVQPVSGLGAQPVTLVEWVWSGATTATSFTVKTAIAPQHTATRLAVSTDREMIDPRYVEVERGGGVAETDIVSFAVDGLAPDTEYWYAVEGDGGLDLPRQGRVRTFPAGPASFTFAFGACATTGSNRAVFDTIRETDPLFFLSTGDLFYENIEVNDAALYRTAYDQTLSSPAQSALYRSAPVAYVWDDHDFGPNDADGTSPSRAAARASYREVVPNYPLPAGDGDRAIYQAFTVGRVRFIVTDVRSERSPETAVDDASKTMLGAEQKAWFKQELLAANGRYPLIVWVNTLPWIAEAKLGADGWGPYATERRELADFIAEHDIRGLAMLSGDGHMLAIDDGTNSNYAADGGHGFPVFHAGALDRHGSRKGGPYSEGQLPGGGQFGLMTVNDDGGSTIEIVWSGRNWKGEELISHRFTVPALPIAPVASRVANGQGTSVPLHTGMGLVGVLLPLLLLPALTDGAVRRCARPLGAGRRLAPQQLRRRRPSRVLSCPLRSGEHGEESRRSARRGRGAAGRHRVHRHLGLGEGQRDHR